jgi:aminopeptidase YwaD
MQRFARIFGLAAALGLLAGAAEAAPAKAPGWTVKREWVAAEARFLASDALQGRGSATRDEAIAAAYVASQFESFGLTAAPGQAVMFQTATVIKPRLKGEATIRVDGAPVAGAQLLIGPAADVGGKAVVFAADDVLTMPAADVVISTSKASPLTVGQTAMSKHVKLLILKESVLTQGLYRSQGGTDMASYLQGTHIQRTAVATLPAEAFERLAAHPGAAVELALPPMTQETATTTNVIGYLKGRDPKAGALVVSAHLDHLGVRPDGTIMHGANDDASGMVAVMELARAMSAMSASGKAPKRSLLFIGYGSEEIGKYGSTWFAQHPAVPLAEIVANIEFEMVGQQDPKLPPGSLFVTGSERSTLWGALKAHGAPVAADTDPAQHYFERSDNWPLAQAGVVAHTLAGWTTTPTYHQASDTFERLDLTFMTGAIQSMIAPLRWLADSDFRPAWNEGGRPTP